MSNTDTSASTQTEKIEWSRPQLMVHGGVEKITQGCTPKQHGPTDSIALKAPPIHCAS